MLMSLIDQARRMAPSLSRGMSFVYILELRSGMLYVGCSDDLEQRLTDHLAGACHTTAKDPPAAIRLLEAQHDCSFARKREAQIKKWSRAKKEALIRGDFKSLRDLSKSRE